MRSKLPDENKQHFNFLKSNRLMLLVGSRCNSSCIYCPYNFNTNDMKLRHQSIQDAWYSGSYIKNIQNLFNKLNIPVTSFTKLSLWGGEPLLDMDMLTDNIESLFNIFKNICFISMPTNFTVDPRKGLIKFLKKLDSFGRKIAIVITISDDFIPELNELHRHNLNTLIDNNINIITNELNNSLENIYVSFSRNSVLTLDEFIYYFNTEDNIRKYFTVWDDKFKLENTRGIKCRTDQPYPTLKFKLPYKCSTYQGIQISDTYKRIDDVLNKVNYFNKYSERPGNCVTSAQFTFPHLANNTDLSVAGLCNSYDNQFIVDEHGNLHNCYWSVYNSYNNILSSVLNINQFERFKPAIMDTKVYDNIVINQVRELAKSGQILNKYTKAAYDDIKIYRHCHHCPNENIVNTNMYPVPGMDELRLFFNGLSDYILSVMR